MQTRNCLKFQPFHSQFHFFFIRKKILNGHPASTLTSLTSTSLDEVKMNYFSTKKEKLELVNLKCVIYKQSISLSLKALGICKFVYMSFIPSLLLLTTLSCIIISYVICKVLASICHQETKTWNPENVLTPSFSLIVLRRWARASSQKWFIDQLHRFHGSSDKSTKLYTTLTNEDNYLLYAMA